MRQFVLFALTGTGGLVLSTLGFWFAYMRPERARRRRFFDMAFGHDGSDGLPEQRDIFTQQQELLEAIRDLRASNTAQQAALNQLVAEIPVNGVPLRTVIEAIREDQEIIKAGMKLTDLNVANVRRKQSRIERVVRETEARWIAKLQAQGIETPEKRMT